MFVLSNVLMGVAVVLAWILSLYKWILIARMILSWVNPRPSNPLGAFVVNTICALTDPPMTFIRRRLPASLRYFPLDMAFLVLFALVIFAEYAVVQSLVDLAQSLRHPRPAPTEVF